MSTQQFSMDRMFDLHRSFVAQQVEFTRDALEAQQELIASAEDGIELWRDVAERQAAFARSTAEQIFQQFPEDVEAPAEFETMVEESIIQLEQANEMTFDATEDAVGEATQAYGRFADAYVEALETGSESYIEATERIEEATETVAEEIEIE